MLYTSRETYEYISQQTNDPILEWESCAVSGTQFPIYQSDLEFYTKISPTFAGQKFAIPAPSLCPEERQRRRLSFRNERKLYKRKCDFSGKPIISIYSPDKPYKIYDEKIWRSDDRDPMSYGRDFDFGKSFTENFRDLMLVVPRLPLYASKNENSDYVNGAAYNKNCYLIFASDYNEDCLYSDSAFHCQACLDVSDVNSCIQSYELIGCGNCSGSMYSINCYNARNLGYCLDCRECESCYLCYGLRNKQYCFKNKQYTLEEYHQNIAEYKKSGNENRRDNQDFGDTINKSIYSAYNGIANTHCSGNFITNSSNSQNIYSCHEMHGCKNIITGNQGKDCHDSYVIIGNSQLCYENISSIGLYSCISTMCCRNTNKYLYYCDHCQNSSYLFGCIGLRGKSYCIFNKQYSKQEYEKIVSRIISYMQETGERGEFFHPSLSPFGYNETVAQEYYPLSKQQITNDIPQQVGSVQSVVGSLSGNIQFEVWSQCGYHRSDYTSDPINTTKIDTLSGEQIPRDISTVTDDILTKVFICEVSQRPFRIQKAELLFYRKHGIPLPRKHPDIRYEERIKLRPGKTLFLRTCDKCGKEMLSVYEKEIGDQRLEIGKIYCETCYQQEVYG